MNHSSCGNTRDQFLLSMTAIARLRQDLGWRPSLVLSFLVEAHLGCQFQACLYPRQTHRQRVCVCLFYLGDFFWKLIWDVSSRLVHNLDCVCVCVCVILSWWFFSRLIPLIVIFIEKENKMPGCLVAQLVKNAPAMQKSLVQFLGQEDPLEKG